MLKLKFADNTEKEVLQDTVIYPSGSPSIRSRMEVHMSADAMPLQDFEALMSDPAKTRTLRLIETGADEAGGEMIVRDTAYSAYTLVASVGKQRVDKLDYTSGQAVGETHLVAVLEQLTYIEQQLAALGLRV